MTPSIPTATYRLQFNKHFTFTQARQILPYLDALGISHVYASPYFQAGEESMHGYDIRDHSALNPAIGTREEYDAFVRELHARGMRQILDFVPNHMGIGDLNKWWMDVLENGPSSAFANYFDIDWRPLKDELENKVLLPILGNQYGQVLEKGEFKIEFESGAFFLRYYDHKLPLAPRSYALILARAERRLGEKAAPEFMAELRSIITSLEHLPSRVDTDPAKIEERAREKEIVKRRIERLCVDSGEALEAIQTGLAEMAGTAGDARSFDAMDELLNSQVYRLSYWRVAAEEINYRRFFDINDLVAIRIEVPEVFEAVHRFLFELIGAGAIDGLRIDHVDGLWNPREYLEKLQVHCADAFVQKKAGTGTPMFAFADKVGTSAQFYLLVEKILTGPEKLRRDWPVHGTTGYDFLNEVVQVLVDASAAEPMAEIYERFIGDRLHFDDLIYQKKQLTMRLSLASEVNVLASLLNRLSEKNRWYRDFTLNALTAVVREVIACFPVYRTYLEPGGTVGEEDRRVIARAIALAKRRNPGMERSAFDFLGEILLLQFPPNIDEAAREAHEFFVLKFQQCTGPIMAKGLEDTAFYLFNRLVALNDVGGEPQHFGTSPEKFHVRNVERVSTWPQAMLATSTHDTKRSEDVRMRIAAISEVPRLWRDALRRWKTIAARYKTEIDGVAAPDPNEEYLLYQTLLGTWPLPSRKGAHSAPKEYVTRIQDYMTKAVKEAKVNSSWIEPNEAWDNATRGFIAAILEDKKFRQSFEPLAQTIAELGAINSLSQLVLKCTAPGVPDFYQGTEVWNFTLVDPDNRQPVDYPTRQKMLASLGDDVEELLHGWRDGRLKLFAIEQLLRLRREEHEFFAVADYLPVELEGTYEDCAIAFLRASRGKSLLVLVPRLSARIGFPPLGARWKDTRLKLPRGFAKARNIFTKDVFPIDSTSVAVADLLVNFPAAVLFSKNA